MALPYSSRHRICASREASPHEVWKIVCERVGISRSSKTQSTSIRFNFAMHHSAPKLSAYLCSRPPKIQPIELLIHQKKENNTMSPAAGSPRPKWHRMPSTVGERRERRGLRWAPNRPRRFPLRARNRGRWGRSDPVELLWPRFPIERKRRAHQSDEKPALSSSWSKENGIHFWILLNSWNISK